MKRKALGKGLGSLIPKSRGRRPELLRVPRSGVDDAQQIPNRERRSMKPTFSRSRSRSADGILQPVVARPAAGGGYEIIAGERRWRAARSAGLKRIPVMVQEIADDRALELALVENLQRRDLDPLEEAKAFRLLSERFDLRRIRCRARRESRSAVANTLRILKLPAGVQDSSSPEADAGARGERCWRSRARRRILSLARGWWTSSSMCRTAEGRNANRSGRKRPARETPVQDPNVRSAQERLQSRLGTKVSIDIGVGGRGGSRFNSTVTKNCRGCSMG